MGTRSRARSTGAAVALAIVSVSSSYGEAPPPRDQRSLGGQWVFTPQAGSPRDLTVPCAWPYLPADSITEATYEREVEVPAEWDGKRVFLELEALNYVAEVFVDEVKVLDHVGGSMPVRVDITDATGPGNRFDLRVHVKGSPHEPVAQYDGEKWVLQWPVSYDPYMWKQPWYPGWGIVLPVWLRAYGHTHVAATAIATSVEDATLALDYDLVNADAEPHTVSITALVSDEPGSAVLKTLTSTVVTLAAGETTRVALSTTWPDVTYWWPNRPKLYCTQASVFEDGQAVDTEVRRFGFREFSISGNQFYLNGVRVNLYGDSYVYSDADTPPPLSEFAQTVDNYKRVNANVVRFHAQPTSDALLDVCDEKGILIIEESPVYGGHWWRKGENYIANCATLIDRWVSAHRNHPSVVMWSVSNEILLKGNFPKDTIRACVVENRGPRTGPSRRGVHRRPRGNGGDPLHARGSRTTQRHVPRAGAEHGEGWRGEIPGSQTFQDSGTGISVHSRGCRPRGYPRRCRGFPRPDCSIRTAITRAYPPTRAAILLPQRETRKRLRHSDGQPWLCPPRRRPHRPA